jgi:hypothetical protein
MVKFEYRGTSNYPVNACGYIYILFYLLVNIRRRHFGSFICATWSSCHFRKLSPFGDLLFLPFF